MAKYFSVEEASLKWELSINKIKELCDNGVITGIRNEKGEWLIPSNTEVPTIPGLKKSFGKDIKFRFIDLFAGIGGFHQAMRFLGGGCVMAAEKNQACVDTYKLNFTTEEGKIRGDVNKIDPADIAPFQVLCAGFPCQPFSKAGHQKGFKDKERGNLFYKIMDMLDVHREVQFVILENVRNLADKTENWDIIRTELQKRDFIITENALILSPSDFGLPQIRERVYILGIKKNCCNQRIREQGFITKNDLHLNEYYKKCKTGDAFSILVDDVPDEYLISEEQNLMINAWDEFRIATKITTIGYPIWINCFGIGIDDDEELKRSLKYDDMPDWKKNFVNKNRALYKANKSFIDGWIKKYDMLSRIKLYQKFEWNCGDDVKDMHDAIIQIRQSGIRVKRTTFFPSLVAMVNTPIIWDKNKQAYRYITPREAANLQSFDQRYKFAGTDKQKYRQLGNSVNVRVLKIICKNLFELRAKDE